MQQLKIYYKDYVNCQVTGLTPDDKNMLYKKYSLFVKGAIFNPKFKMGMWDGYSHMFSLVGNTYINFIPEIISSLDMSQYELVEEYAPTMAKLPQLNPIDNTFLNCYKWGKEHRLAGQPVEMFDHQVDIVNACFKNTRSVIEAATGAGKTLVSLALAKEVSKYGRFIIVEPSKDLTLQTAQTFRELGFDCGVCGCGLRELDNQVTICTWQTINSLEKRKKDDDLNTDKRLLSAIELKRLTTGTIGILFDECHTCKAYHIQKICSETFKDVPIRWGLTGTVPKDATDKMSLLISLGPVVHNLESRELQERGILADCDITCVRLEDNSAFLSYTDEVNYLSGNTERLDFVSSLLSNIVTTKNNTLVLVNRIATGEYLEQRLKDMGRDCIFLDGSIKSTKRFDEYRSINTTNNKILIATVQIASTGLDIPRLFNLVLLDIGKSFVRVIQSIGRGLRLGKDKNHVDVFDIHSTTPHSRKHFNDRLHYYDEKGFKFKVLKVPNWK